MSDFIDVASKLLPLLNVLLIPIARGAYRLGKRLDCIEFNQRRICDKVGVEYIEIGAK
jgi:hypothetical protein